MWKTHYLIIIINLLKCTGFLKRKFFRLDNIPLKRCIDFSSLFHLKFSFLILLFSIFKLNVNKKNVCESLFPNKYNRSFNLPVIWRGNYFCVHYVNNFIWWCFLKVVYHWSNASGNVNTTIDFSSLFLQKFSFLCFFVFHLQTKRE